MDDYNLAQNSTLAEENLSEDGQFYLHNNPCGFLQGQGDEVMKDPL
jgi:hypothetical protein